MTQKEELDIEIEQPSNRFGRFLEEESNRRIVFSAKYGDGKTTFLKAYFDKYSEYKVIWLNPIRYTLSGNADIVSLMKYDIVYELLLDIKPQDGIIENRTAKATRSQMLPAFLANNGEMILREFAGAIPKIGKPIKSIWNRFASERSKQNEKTNGTLDKLFMGWSDIEQHPLFSIDVANELIEEWCNIRQQKNSLKTVLIIDDLDRLFPEDVFRILNVLSAEFAFDEEQEGFLSGFNHVIAVCHEPNIRSVFHHMYGQEADYKGYFDKFVSKRVFDFTNEDAIQSWVAWTFRPNMEFVIDEVMKQFLSNAVSTYVSYGQLNLRSLLKIGPTEIEKVLQSVSSSNRDRHGELEFATLYVILVHVFGAKEDLMKATDFVVERIYDRDRKRPDFDSEQLIRYLFPMAQFGLRSIKGAHVDPGLKETYTTHNPKPASTMPIGPEELTVSYEQYKMRATHKGNSFKAHTWVVLRDCLKIAERYHEQLI